MPSCDVNSYFVSEAGRFIGDVSERGRMRSWWSSLGGNGMPSEPWPNEMGYTLSNIIWERSGASGGAGWSVVAANNGGGGSQCVPDPSVVSSSNTVRTTSLYQRYLTTEYLCVNDIRSAYEFKQQVAAIRDNFRDEIIDIWEDRNRDQYIIASQHKVVFNPQLPDNTSGTTVEDFPAQAATSPITQKYLDIVRFNLQRNAAEIDGGAYAKEDGQPVFAVIMSGEQQEALFQSGGTIYQSSRINQDLRYAEPSKLLKAYGVNRSYHGWFHIIDNKAPRYNFVNGAYVRVPFYTTAAATNGTQLIVNPDYLNATFELVIVFLPTVITRMIPPQFASAGSGAEFRPWNYAGEVQWVNEYDRVCNPLKNQGYWAAVLQAAYMPKKIENGYSIMVKRCQGDLEQITCSGS